MVNYDLWQGTWTAISRACQHFSAEWLQYKLFLGSCCDCSGEETLHLHHSMFTAFSSRVFPGWTTWVISDVWIVSRCQVFLAVISFQFNLWIGSFTQSSGSRTVSKQDKRWPLLATLLQFNDIVLLWIRGRGIKRVVVLFWHSGDVFKERHAPQVHISPLPRPALNCTRATISWCETLWASAAVRTPDTDFGQLLVSLSRVKAVEADH